MLQVSLADYSRLCTEWRWQRLQSTSPQKHEQPAARVTPCSPTFLCLSRLLGLTQATTLATCTEYICCISKSIVALLGWCQLVRDTHSVHCVCWGWLSCRQLRTPSLPKAPGGLSLKAAGHQICSLLTPQGTKPHLSQPNKPRHWLAPFLEMGQPPWAPLIPSIQSRQPGHLLHLKFPPHHFLCPSIPLFSVQKQLTGPGRFQLPAHFWLHLSHSHSTVGLQTDSFWTTPEASAALAQRKGSLRSTGILYGIILLFVKLSLPSFHKSFQLPFHTQWKLKLGLPPPLNFHWRQNFEFIIFCHLRKARIWILTRAP